MLCRRISTQWSRCSIPSRSSSFVMSTAPYIPFRIRFWELYSLLVWNAHIMIFVGVTTKQWSWWKTVSWITYPPSRPGIGRVLLSIGRASSAFILVIPTGISQLQMELFASMDCFSVTYSRRDQPRVCHSPPRAALGMEIVQCQNHLKTPLVHS